MLDGRQQLLETLLGKMIMIEYVGVNHPTGDEAETMGAEDATYVGAQVGKMRIVVLEGYDQFGIEVRDRTDGTPTFISWGAVLNVEPLGPEQDEQTEEGGDPSRRQELMDLMASAGTPTQVAVARAAADSWLADHPSDGDVRAARDQLPDVYPTED